MSMTFQDYFIPDSESSCCSAPILITDMCSKCYEHCEEASYENKHLLDVTDPNEPSEEAYLASFKEGA